MPSITSWTRLEPRTQLSEPERSLEARVHDPAWLLARQWQLGELRAEDAGTPVAAAITVRRAAFALDERVPLDAVIAGASPAPDLHLRARAGLRLVEALDRAGFVGRRQHYLDVAPLAVADPVVAEWIAVVGGRVPDGARLVEIVANELTAGVDAALVPVLEGWLAWASPLLSPRADAWDTARLAYRFPVDPAGGPRLAAPAFRGGDLDWYQVDAVAGAASGTTTNVPETVVHATPVPVRYPGMPATRFWQFEDDAVYFGGVEAGARDLGRMLFVELALVGADDWFVVPVPVTPGASYTIGSLAITDSFGRIEQIDPADLGLPGSRWAMFRPAGEDGTPIPGLVVLPSPAGVAADEPVEDLRLIRDEMANLAWGVERRIAGPMGTPLELAEMDLSRRTASPPGAELAYRLRTDVPPTYVPLVPRMITPGQIELVRGRLPGAGPAAPRGQLLAEIDVLPEDIVPRAGLRVLRRWRYLRWIDGSIHIVAAREVELGAAAPASVLAFDVLRDQPPS